MKLLRKFLTTFIIPILIIAIVLENNCHIAMGISKNDSSRAPVKVGLFSKDLTDDYLVYIRNNLEDIQKNNEGKVVFSFYDAKSNESIQNSEIDSAIREGINLIILDMVNTNSLGTVVKKAAQYDIPIIIFNREPLSLDPIKSYKKALYIGTDSEQAGILLGKMIADAWTKHKDVMDKNKDDILQYIMLVGERYNKTAINRSKYSISTLQEAGIKTEELASPILNWNENLARSTIDSLFSKYDDKIEVIISNDDSMAIGAVEALQKYGYNTGDKSKAIPIVGVDLVPEAKELIQKGLMLGSPSQDPKDMATAIYTIGMNLVNNKPPVEGTQYKLDQSGVAVRIPFQAYVGPMFD